MNDETTKGHGLTVQDIPRGLVPPRTHPIPAGSEPCGDGIVSELRDLRDMPLGQIANDATNGDTAVDRALARITPGDGSRVMLVAASFNSAI